MGVSEIVSLAFISMLITLSVWLAFLQAGTSQAASAGIINRLLYPSRYLNPHERICPSPTCRGKNPPTAVRCTLPTHEPGTDDDLSLQGEVITKTGVRVWVLRVLFGLVTSSLLLVGQPLAVYAAVAAIAIWILLPMMACQTTGRFVFLLILVGVLAGIGVFSFVQGQDTITQLTTLNPSLLPTLNIGPLHVNLSAGSVTLVAIWLNGLVAAGALIGTLMSVWGQLRHRAEDYDGVLSVAFMGTFVGTLLLVALSLLQRLDGLAQLYTALAVTSFGWLLVAFVERAVVRSLATVHWEPINRLPWHPLPIPEKPKFTLRRATARGPFADLVRMIQVLIFGITRGAIEVIYTLLALVIGAVNLLVGLLVAVVNMLVSMLVWLLRYLVRVFVSLLSEVVRSLPALYRLGTAGFRILLYGPALIFGTSLLLVTCVKASFRYLASGNLLDFAAALAGFAGVAVCLALAATLYVDWSILRSFFNLLQEYVPSAILYFAIYLDLYGASRLLLHMPSHFGLVSVALNVIVGAGLLFGLAQQRAQKGAS